MISSFAYLIGLAGGIGGLYATMKQSFLVSPEIGLTILLGSIAVLWAGVLLEAIEEHYIELS